MAVCCHRRSVSPVPTSSTILCQEEEEKNHSCGPPSVSHTTISSLSLRGVSVERDTDRHTGRVFSFLTHYYETGMSHRHYLSLTNNTHLPPVSSRNRERESKNSINSFRGRKRHSEADSFLDSTFRMYDCHSSHDQSEWLLLSFRLSVGICGQRVPVLCCAVLCCAVHGALWHGISVLILVQRQTVDYCSCCAVLSTKQ